MDLRKDQPYEVYPELDFDIPVTNGDCYDRYLVRMKKCVSLIAHTMHSLVARK